MPATINDFFGSNFEQEVIDEVTLWEGDAPNTVKFTLSESSANFEELVFYSGFKEGSDQNVYPLTYAVFPKDAITKPTFLNTTVGSRYRSATKFASVNVTKNSPTEFTCYADVSADWAGRITKVVGRRRRIARVGLDELMASMGMPNLVTNPDLNNPVNQRAFNGNWSSLAVGAYGYDQWIKVSNTHMGFVIEDGKYIPNKMHTLTVNNAVTKQIISPASGHFVVAIPFATSGVYDFYAGEFKRPWHPSISTEFACTRYYERSANPEFMWPIRGGDVVDNTQARCTLRFAQAMRVTPTLTGEVRLDAVNSGGTLVNAEFQFVSNKKGIAYPQSDRKPTSYATLDHWTADASIPWSELNNKVITAA